MAVPNATPETVLVGKYPAKAHAQRVASLLLGQDPSAKGVIFLEGQETRMLEDSDMPEPFRQRRYFYYLSGCTLPDCALTYDLETAELTLFIPPVDPEDVIWSGLPLTPEEARHRYDVDHVRLTSEIDETLGAHARTGTIFAIDHVRSTRSLAERGLTPDVQRVKGIIETCRVVKDSYEVALTREANGATARAHAAVMRAVSTTDNEQELQALFVQRCMAARCPIQAYSPIVAAGESAATLHYVANDAPLAGKLNLLLDAGAEYRCYASDVTRTFPIHGRFTPESRAVYEVVLKMQEEGIAMLKAGVLWEDVHMHAHRVAIRGLLDLGILKGAAEAIFETRTSVAFFPHGLGHYLGLDTHDVGGHANYRDADTMFRYLRVRGRLPAGSIITVEPGIYFCRFIIEPYLNDPTHAPFIDQAVLDRYWTVGGVRIEDNVLVTDDGYENLTTAVKGVDEMERLVRGGT
ncbi:MAG: hypothetical protein M1838_000092 [Thelocarpon superellum]|nr:MAG: hypothetical protein M1838_000092 [Thelocarpon superellum]